MHGDNPPTHARDLRFHGCQPTVIDVCQNDVSASAGQRECGAAPDAAGASSDHRHLARDVHASAGITSSATSSTAQMSEMSLPEKEYGPSGRVNG